MSPSSFFERLSARVRAADSLLCVGIDPRGADLPTLREECFRLVDATAEFAAAFKPNSAFFEAFGGPGIDLLRQVIEHIPEGIPVILDVKRGDIAETTAAYARAAFDTLGAQAVTVNPYVGGEALSPFLSRPDRGIFVLCKTSNPGADEFQSLTLNGRPLFEIVAEHAQRWNQRGNVGLVLGATDPTGLARAREVAPDLWFLVVGVGAQGGQLAAAVSAGLRQDGLGILMGMSRGLSASSDPRMEARRVRDEINRVAREVRATRPAQGGASRTATVERDYSLRELAHDLVATGCVRFGEFQLKSGLSSPIYIDLRRLVSQPTVLRRVAKLYADVLQSLKFDRLAGIPYAGLPIATAVSLELDKPMIYPRRDTKDYGMRAAIEGDYQPGETAVMVDDLATTGGTKIEAIRKLEEAGLAVRDIVVLIDREQGASAMLADAGYSLHAVVTLRQLLKEWEREGAVTSAQCARVMEFLGSTTG